jgi:formate hydrogenlyase subunit 3/multisubunit Na+/H+ antiporter MnhD subunit
MRWKEGVVIEFRFNILSMGFYVTSFFVFLTIGIYNLKVGEKVSKMKFVSIISQTIILGSK